MHGIYTERGLQTDSLNIGNHKQVGSQASHDVIIISHLFRLCPGLPRGNFVNSFQYLPVATVHSKEKSHILEHYAQALHHVSHI